MKNPSNNELQYVLPVTCDLNLAYILTIIVVVGMGVLSLLGLTFPDSFYPSEEFIQSFLVNDVINLILGIPILLGSMWLTRQGKLIGLLFWPGALLYVLYNYTAYIFGLPFNVVTIAYLVLVLLCVMVMYLLLKCIDGESVKAQLQGNVPVKLSGWILILFGVVFIFRAIGAFMEAGASQTALPITEVGVLIADMTLSVLMIVGGALLLRRKPLGYSSALGLLFAASMLFIGLILILLLQPVITETTFVLIDLIVVFIMGMVCFIPFGLFLRGVLSAEKPS
jgi:hypothetical protein